MSLRDEVLRFGGMGMLSGQPIFQQQMGGGMFGGGGSGFVGANRGGFVGGRPGAMSSQEYFAMEQARQQQQLELSLKRRALRADQQSADRELSLKEMLANHQMGQDRAASGLARDRLGLDSDTARNDAIQRANALSLQERLGWAGENRMSSADQNQDERARAATSLQERLGLMSEGRLSRGQDQDEDFRRAQLGQQAQLAQMPYNRMTMADAAQSDFQNRQLGQQDRQFNRQFTDMPLADRSRLSLAEKQQTLDQSNADRAFNDLSAGQRQTGQLEQQRMGMTERLAGGENQLRRELQRETLAQQLQMWSGLSAADKQQNQQFGQSLAQKLHEFKNLSAADTESFNQRGLDRTNQREMFDEGQTAENWRDAGRQVQGDLDRTSREKIQNLGVLAQLLGGSNALFSPEDQEAMVNELRGQFPMMQNSPLANPQERQTRTLLDNLRAAAEMAALGKDKKATTPDELQQVNAETARMIDEGRRSGFFRDEATDTWIRRMNSQGGSGVKTVAEILKDFEKSREADRIIKEINRRQPAPSGPGSYARPGFMGGVSGIR